MVEGWLGLRGFLWSVSAGVAVWHLITGQSWAAKQMSGGRWNKTRNSLVGWQGDGGAASWICWDARGLFTYPLLSRPGWRGGLLCVILPAVDTQAAFPAPDADVSVLRSWADEQLVADVLACCEANAFGVPIVLFLICICMCTL